MTQLLFINANRELPPENKTVLFRDLKKNDKIIKAAFGTWMHPRDGEYTCWHVGDEFVNYLDAGQYWIEIPELP